VFENCLDHESAILSLSFAACAKVSNFTTSSSKPKTDQAPRACHLTYRRVGPLLRTAPLASRICVATINARGASPILHAQSRFLTVNLDNFRWSSPSSSSIASRRFSDWGRSLDLRRWSALALLRGVRKAPFAEPSVRGVQRHAAQFARRTNGNTHVIGVECAVQGIGVDDHRE
jgi:hypothetical protein